MIERASDVYRFFDVAGEWWASKASNLMELDSQHMMQSIGLGYTTYRNDCWAERRVYSVS
jgi:hypothetical protein